MKKIYYLQKIEVELGDLIAYKGFKATVTEELIELNSELFKVEENIQPMYFKCTRNILGVTLGRVYEQICHDCYPNLIFIQDDDSNKRRIYIWQGARKGANYYGFELTTKAEWDKQELLDKAKRRYPIGTIIKTKYGIHKVLENKPFVCPREYSIIQIKTDRFSHGTNIYTIEDGWAEILPIKFTTQDGVEIYGDMKTWIVDTIDLSLQTKGVYAGNNNGIMYFYHKENALAYIEKHKEKTLEDYENMLLRTNIDSVNAREECLFYHTLKVKEPKLYYTKILQLIADDLNNGWIADFTNNDEKWCISEKDIIHYMKLKVHGLVYFRLSELAEKARVILGGKVGCYFN